MGFEEFGIVSFAGVSKAEDFVMFLKRQEIRGTTCLHCGTKFFPPRSDCHVCFSSDMEWFPITGEGVILTYTKALFAPAGFEKDVPYVLAIAEFPDGLKVFGRIDPSIPDNEIKAGMKTKIRIVNLENGRLTYELTGA